MLLKLRTLTAACGDAGTALKLSWPTTVRRTYENTDGRMQDLNSRLDRKLAEREVLVLLLLLERLEGLLLLGERLADCTRLLEAQVERLQVLVLVEGTQLRLLCLVDHGQDAGNRLTDHLAASDQRESDSNIV